MRKKSALGRNMRSCRADPIFLPFRQKKLTNQKGGKRHDLFKKVREELLRMGVVEGENM